MDAWPDQFKLLPLCRAIIVVLDEIVDVDLQGGEIYIDLEVHRQNVLMVRTGNQTGLSEPISFESIRELALPLARPDQEIYDDIDAIRVPLSTAVQFMVNLQRREEVAFPASAPSTMLQGSLCPSAHHTDPDLGKITNVDEWVDSVMKLADEKGIENVRSARDAMSTVQAPQPGEDTVCNSPYYFEGRWR